MAVQPCLGIADELKALLEAEKKGGKPPDWHLDAFMKAYTLEGKGEAIATEYILRILGLDVRPSLLLDAPAGWPCCFCMHTHWRSLAACSLPESSYPLSLASTHSWWPCTAWRPCNTMQASDFLFAHASSCLASLSAHVQVCQDTPVGSDMIRGISGGQKRRVTSGMLRHTACYGPCS